jgi:hypothetical protein
VENQHTEKNEIDFKLISRFLKSYLRSLFSSWKVLVIALILGAGIGRLFSWFIGVNYSSTLSYAIQNNATSSAISSALSLASSFGIAGKTTGSFDVNYFSELSKSSKIIKETLLQKVKINGKEDLLANHFYYCSKFHKKWDDTDDPLYQFKFKHNTIKSLTRLEDSVLTVYYDYIVDRYLTLTTAENFAFNHINFISPNRDFSIAFLNSQIELIHKHYLLSIENMNAFNFDVATRRVDSLAEAIRIADSKVARLKDNSANTVKQSGLIDLNNAIREQTLLNIQYSAAVNNFEASKTALISTAPVIQVIDEPDFTVEVKYFDPIVASIVGAIILLVMALGLLFMMKLFSS